MKFLIRSFARMFETTDEKGDSASIADKPLATGLIIFAGILLPVITLIAELSTKMCADSFFDPIPSLWHVLIVAAVPLANAQLVWSLYHDDLKRKVFLAWISAISAGASILYSLIFLPLSPLSLFGIIFAGLGFLPLSPFFSLWAIFRLRRNLAERMTDKPFPLTWLGLGTGFWIVLAIVGLSESRFIVTRYGLEKAAAGSVEQREQGIDFLRKYGNEDYILRLTNSYRRQFYISDFAYDLFKGSASNSQEIAGEAYYRLTGRTADSVAVPTRFSFGDNEERFWREREISLAASQMDGVIDNEASLGYVEWTFSLRNSNKYRAEEGFTQIQLPPNAVVSRVTLWINGEEREAAFAGQGRVTKAYEQVTAKKRDPVLVTSAGRDRINLKCFPIPQGGGEMKMRIGITFPMILEDEKNGLIRLPYFRDKNFQIPEDFKHSIWLESSRELQSANQNLKLETKEKLFAVRGKLADKEITNSNSAIRAVKSGDFKMVWARDGEQFVTQEVVPVFGVKPARYVFVVDTAGAMTSEQENIAAAIESLPQELETALILTNGNALNKNTAYPESFSGNPSDLAEKIRQAEFGGGTDNLPALSKGWDVANEKQNSVVVWLHSPQPFKFSSSNELVQRLTRRPYATTVYSLSTASGLDEVEKELNDLSYLYSVPRFGDLQQDLNRLVMQLNQSKKSFGYNRVKADRFNISFGKETSKHLVRLWANDKVNRILTAGNDETKAVDLAVKNQLVTPVTGAVVLETQEQYDQFGLQPVNKNSVPTIPEPEFYLLLAVVLGVMVWLFVIRKLF